MRPVLLAAAIACACISPALAQQPAQATLQIKSGVANLIDNPAGSKEIELKQKLAAACDGKTKCSHKGSELVPDGKFLIEVIYECRDGGGSARQKGPLQIKGNETLELTCQN